MPEYFDQEGNVTDAFRESVAEWAGEAHAGTKAMDDVKTIGGLVKMALDSKSAASRNADKFLADLGDSVIRKPGEDASEGDLAEYRQALALANGVPENIDGYELSIPDSIPEEVRRSDEDLAAIKQTALELGIGKEKLEKLAAVVMEQDARSYAAAIQQQQDAHQEAIDLFKADFRGDKLMIAGREAYKAIMEFGPEALKAAVKDGKLYENPGDFDAWLKAGLTPQNIRLWQPIGKRLLAGKMITSDGDTSEVSDERAQDMKMYPNSPQLWRK